MSTLLAGSQNWRGRIHSILSVIIAFGNDKEFNTALQDRFQHFLKGILRPKVPPEVDWEH